MAEYQPKTLEQRLRKRFAGFVSRRGSRIATLLDTIRIMRERGWTAFAFGGTPRGVFDNGRRYQPRDLDLVFDDEHFTFFESTFERHILKRNRFGGLHIRIDSLVIDAWPLSATWAFREGHVRDASFENLPQTTFLNIDGIIIEVTPPKGRPRRIFEAGFFDAWRNRTLDINLLANPFPALCVVRTLRLSHRFGFRLSHRLALYAWEMLSSLAQDELLKVQASHYGCIDFDADRLSEIRARLEKHLANVGLLPLALFPVRPDQMEFQLSTAPAHDLHELRSFHSVSSSRGNTIEDLPLWQRRVDGFANYLVASPSFHRPRPPEPTVTGRAAELV